MNTHTYFSVVFLLSILSVNQALAHGNTPPSLKGIAVPTTPTLLDGDAPMVVNKTAAIQLGKALFWDTAVGSDGMACASCHFHAGADARVTNQLSTGALHHAPTSATFEPTASGGKGGVNVTLKRSDFPLHKLANPLDKNSQVLFNTDDVVSSAGVFNRVFNSVNETGSQTDSCTAAQDRIFHSGTLNTRKVQTRQAPSVINAAYNFRNFWDGRANNIFNGVSPFGARDSNATIWVVQQDGSVRQEKLRLENASLASQAVGPVLNDGEMSCSQRAFPDVGRKLLARRPLEKQAVHYQDSVLAVLRDKSGKGLNTSYEALIKTAFAPRYWSGLGDFGKAADAAPYTQAEANFSLFFGLALQLYQDTLISDQTAFDTPRNNDYPQIPQGLNNQEENGLRVFLNAHCANCHRGPTLSAAAHPEVYTQSTAFDSLRLVNRKTLNGAFTNKGVLQGLMDEGYFNTSVTPENQDLGVGGSDPFGNPLSFTEQYLQKLRDGTPMIDPIVVNSCDFDNAFTMDFKGKELMPDTTITGSCSDRARYAKLPIASIFERELAKGKMGRLFSATKGAFKVPSLRNVELTAPYMHNGSLLTLEQVVDFYFRGGNFSNDAHFATVVFQQPISAQEKADLVAFLKSLTDERVRWERAPFDHPQLDIPNGHTLIANGQQPQQAKDEFLTIPAVGKNGRDAQLGALKAFQNLLQP